MRRLVLTALALAVSLVSASGAQAVVVDDQGDYAGVALSSASASLAQPGISTITSSAPCSDPALTSDLGGPLLPSRALCYQGGNVIHANETFALTWDPDRMYWQTTRDYVEQFLSDVAGGSGKLSSPYAVTSQYTDAAGRAANSSAYGGGCIDYGSVGGYTCTLGDTNGSGTGRDYPGNGCPVTGTNQFSEALGGAFGPGPNLVCLTDAQVQQEVQAIASSAGLIGRAKPGYTPLVVVLTPPGVEVCLDASATLCSANGAASAKFCSYHAQVSVGGTELAYVVQPWTAEWSANTGCVEPDAPVIPSTPTNQEVATDVGAQLVSPLSQGQIAAIVNPSLNGWFANNGSEINDNGCVMLNNGLDTVTVGATAYYLQREFNNAGVLETDPNAPSCAPLVNLAPTFVVPSAVNPGDVVEFDGSTTLSTLIVPTGGYAWDFGDGTTAIGPSVTHSYARGGTYTVKLTATDRGGNVASLAETLNVLGPTGQPVTPPPTSHPPTRSELRAQLLLLPQGLRMLLRHGLALRVSSNEAADGFVSLSITRGAARRAGIRTGRKATVTVGRGTVSGIAAGTVNLHLRLSRGMAKKLGHLRHVTLTVRLTLAAAGGAHVVVDAAGRY